MKLTLTRITKTTPESDSLQLTKFGLTEIIPNVLWKSVQGRGFLKAYQNVQETKWIIEFTDVDPEL